jgi:type IV pilus assembly protein PilF
MLKQWKLHTLILVACLLSACVMQSTNPYNTDSDNTRRARAHTELASAYYQQSQFEVALKEFNIAIELDPNYAAAYNGLGLVHAALGENKKADAAFTKALDLDPKDSDAQNNYGSFLCKTGQYDASIGHFLAAIKNPLYNTPNIAYTNAGICSLRKNDLPGAENYFSKALEIEPLTHPAAYQLANIQFNRGNASAAFKTLANTLMVAPSPQVLWLGIRITRALGDKNNEASYAIQLRKQYPNSTEAKKLMSGQNS